MRAWPMRRLSCPRGESCRRHQRKHPSPHGRFDLEPEGGKGRQDKLNPSKLFGFRTGFRRGDKPRPCGKCERIPATGVSPRHGSFRLTQDRANPLNLSPLLWLPPRLGALSSGRKSKFVSEFCPTSGLSPPEPTSPFGLRRSRGGVPFGHTTHREPDERPLPPVFPGLERTLKGRESSYQMAILHRPTLNVRRREGRRAPPRSIRGRPGLADPRFERCFPNERRPVPSSRGHPRGGGGHRAPPRLPP